MLASFGGPIAVDATSVYVGYYAGLQKIGLNGGTPTRLTNDGGIRDIAVDETSIYYTNCVCGGSSGVCGDGRLMKVALDGSTKATLSGEDNGWCPGSVGVRGTNVYWVEHFGGFGVPQSQVMRVGLNVDFAQGGEPWGAMSAKAETAEWMNCA
jgi:hypothetical protein